MYNAEPIVKADITVPSVANDKIGNMFVKKSPYNTSDFIAQVK